MSDKNASYACDARHWDAVAERFRGGQSIDPLLAEDYRRAHLELCRRWAPAAASPRILKTDVFAEAVCPRRAFSWDLTGDGHLVSVDISSDLVRQARSTAVKKGYSDAMYAVADTRLLPFADDSFDIIVSDSTLDHFSRTAEITTALSELARVLSPGGTLVITLDNPRNLSQPLMILWLKLGWSPFFIGKTLSRRALVKALEDVDLAVTDSGTLLHHFRVLTKSGLRVIRRALPARADRLGRAGLALTDKLGRLPTRERTALFVAARASKPETKKP